MELITKARYTDEENERELRNRTLAYRAACESIVLLKNEGVLPFKDKNIMLYGSGASHTVKGGTGSGEVNERRSVTIYEGLLDRGFNVLSEAWLENYEQEFIKAKEKFEAKQRRAMFNVLGGVNGLFANQPIPDGRKLGKKDIKKKYTDNCVYVVSRIAGEGGDRKLKEGDYFLTKGERENIEFCAKNFRNFVLVVNSGAAIDMSFVDEIDGIGAILFISQLGTEGGSAVADILSGAAVPSGKLASSWAKNYSDLPNALEYSHLNGNLSNEYYKEGIFVGYRFYDSFGVEPRYPFGYGLSYTDFALSDISVRGTGSRFTASVTVKNTGKKYSGKETVQLYVSAPDGRLVREYQSLAAFAKSDIIAPHKTETLELTFDIKQLAAYRSADASFVLEKGEYVVRIGTSSRNAAAVAVIEIAEDTVVSKHEHVCPVRSPFIELEAPRKAAEDVSKLPRLTLAQDSIDTVVHSYKTPDKTYPKPVTDFVDSLTLKEMVDIVVGVGMFGDKPFFNLPGSVGNTTSRFADRGLANATLCDGPAGLRIQKLSTVDENGKVKPVEMAIAILNNLPKPIKKFMVGNPEKDTLLYQFTTAFPVTAALAQTWNSALLNEIGGAILDEMREYGCTYWLAPAINIHRNPLCGRNFEYFSEDPYLTGALASALIKGVQQEEGYYVTVKHFACNNQEENRNDVSSNVSERALREIYLRAFEMCVEEGGAKAVMTSYNKVNSVLAPTSHDLCTKLLRNEWGFEGVVMTDWFSTASTKGASALAMKAGNDLIMPGGSGVKRDIISGVKNGLASEADVRRCCLNVVEQIMNSNIQREYMK